MKYYTDSHVDAAVNTLAARGVPVGGTSAGNAVLAQFGYSGITGSITSQQALANPFSRLITIENGFLHLSALLLDTINDDHFVKRNRVGRLITFMARIIQDGNATQVSGIATNENTALLMEPDGNGFISGTATAYFLRTPPQVCKPRTPLTFNNISIYRIHAGDTFNIVTWTSTGGSGYTISAIKRRVAIDPTGWRNLLNENGKPLVRPERLEQV